jgi:hypothetical protein
MTPNTPPPNDLELERILTNLLNSKYRSDVIGESAAIQTAKSALTAWKAREVEEAQNTIISIFEYLQEGSVEERRQKLRSLKTWNESRKVQLHQSTKKGE